MQTCKEKSVKKSCLLRIMTVKILAYIFLDLSNYAYDILK